MNKLTYLLKNIIHKIDQSINVEPISDAEIDTVFNGQIGTGIVGWDYKANAGFSTISETDLNNVTTQGFYWVNPSTTTTNMPVSNYGNLEVFRSVGTSGGHVMQRFSVWNSATVYERLYINSAWQAWRRTADESRWFHTIASSYTLQTETDYGYVAFSPTGSYVNVWFLNNYQGTCYLKKVVEQTSIITATASGANCTFTNSNGSVEVFILKI